MFILHYDVTSNVIECSFQIPISTLGAVSKLVGGIAGGTSGSLSVSKSVGLGGSAGGYAAGQYY